MSTDATPDTSATVQLTKKRPLSSPVDLLDLKKTKPVMAQGASEKIALEERSAEHFSGSFLDSVNNATFELSTISPQIANITLTEIHISEITNIVKDSLQTQLSALVSSRTL